MQTNSTHEHNRLEGDRALTKLLIQRIATMANAKKRVAGWMMLFGEVDRIELVPDQLF